MLREWVRGGSHARSRAPSGGLRTRAHSHPRTHSTQQHTLPGGATCCLRSVADVCQAIVGVAMMCLLVLASQPGPLLNGHVRGGGSAAVVPRRCPLHPLTCHLHLLLSLVIPAPVQPHPHTDPKGDLSPSPSPQPRRRLNRAARTHLSSARRCIFLRSWCAPWPCRACSRRGRSAAAGVQVCTYQLPLCTWLLYTSPSPRD